MKQAKPKFKAGQVVYANDLPNFPMQIQRMESYGHLVPPTTMYWMTFVHNRIFRERELRPLTKRERGEHP